MLTGGERAVYDWWLTPAVYSCISIILLEARLSHAARRGKKLIYRGSAAMKLLYGGVSAMLTALLCQNWGKPDWPSWGCLVLTGLVVCALLGWPKTIVTDEHGIECHWWWRPKVSIPWKEVEYAETGSIGAIEIVGNQARITYEGYNADRERFCKELTKRSSVKKIVVPGEFTGLHLN
jgi:hypothetical protein